MHLVAGTGATGAMVPLVVVEEEEVVEGPAVRQRWNHSGGIGYWNNLYYFIRGVSLNDSMNLTSF